MIPLVTISPGYSVPPVTRPRGCHVPTKTGCVSHCFCTSSFRLFRRLARFVNKLRDRVGGLTIIEPVPEAVKSILHKILRRSKVEPGIDCLQSALVCRDTTRVMSPGFCGLGGCDEHSWMMLSNPIPHSNQQRRFEDAHSPRPSYLCTLSETEKVKTYVSH